MKKIAVYGSLRQGMYNHSLLGDSKLLETKEIEIPYKMVSFRYYPALVQDNKSNKIIVEIYEVDDNIYKDVEILEGYPDFYDRITVDEADLYVLNTNDDYYDTSHYEYEEHIENWVEYYLNQQKENDDYQQQIIN